MVPLVSLVTIALDVRISLNLLSSCSYTGDDPIGVELSGALKNVYAIATGMVAGLGFDQNARAGPSPLLFSHSFVSR